MDYKHVALALVTNYPKWYPGKLKSFGHTDKIRGDLALELVSLAKSKGLQVVVGNRKSHKPFQKKLSKITNVLLIDRRSWKRSPAQRQVFKTAARLPGVKIIIATEPEKVSLISDCLEQIIKGFIEQNADIVVPKRKVKLFKLTYPSYQFRSETNGNTDYNALLKNNGILGQKSQEYDFLFGPRIFKNDPRVISFFLKKYHSQNTHLKISGKYFDPEQGSNTIFFPVIAAFIQKLKVISIEIPFRYPQLQKKNENYGQKSFFQEKRRRQKLALLAELAYFVHNLKK